MPYLSGGFQSGVGTSSGEPAEIDQTIIFRQTERSAAGVVAYPFSRAQRVEFQGGVTPDLVRSDRADAGVLAEHRRSCSSNDTDETSLADPLTLGTTSAALVFDTSNFGATSPVQGQRYRLEAAPTFGSINFTSVLADYRRYFMPVPFYTIAARVHALRPIRQRRRGPAAVPALHRLSESGARLRRRIRSTPASASPTATSDCPAFDRLIGSRMLVGNIEFRFPLLRPFTGASRGNERAAAGRGRGVRRRRRGLEQGNGRRFSAATGKGWRAPGCCCASISLASPSGGSISRGRSSAPAAAGSFSSTCRRDSSHI